MPLANELCDLSPHPPSKISFELTYDVAIWGVNRFHYATFFLNFAISEKNTEYFEHAYEFVSTYLTQNRKKDTQKLCGYLS